MRRTVLVHTILLFIPIALGILLCQMIQAQSHMIRMEEVGESIRGAWWFANHRVFQGLSSHIGWYAQVTAIYTLFGFHLFAARYYRVVLAVLSCIALISLLKRYMGETWGAILVVLSFVLSPVYLYYSTMGIHFGVDLSYIPLALYVLDMLSRARTNRPWRELSHAVFWGCIMIFWMSYPTMIAYLPSLIYLYGWHVLSRLPQERRTEIAASVLGFLIPLRVGLLWI